MSSRSGMARRPARRAAKWAGVAGCVALAAVWAAGSVGRLGPVRRHASDGRAWIAGCGRGVLVVGAVPALHLSTVRWYEPLSGSGAGVVWGPRWYSGTDGRGVWVPLWMPLAAAVVVTVGAWRADRRARPGHCVCGYDLAGLGAGGSCPECGRAVFE